MLDEKIQRSPIFRGALVAFLVILTLSFFIRPKKKEDLSAAIFAGSFQESMGYVAAEEAAKVLGEAGGTVVLLLPYVGDPDERRFATTSAGAYERGFLEGAKKFPRLKFEGHFLTDPAMHRELQADWNRPTYRTFKLARSKFPKADLFVSFVGLPEMNPFERNEWLSAAPPKMVAIQFQPSTEATRSLLLQQGIVDVIFQSKEGIVVPPSPPSGETHAIVEQFYDIIRR